MHIIILFHLIYVIKLENVGQKFEKILKKTRVWTHETIYEKLPKKIVAYFKISA